MKKFIYLFFAISIFTSCESNEDDSASGVDPIIGVWQLTSDKENGKEVSTDCSRKSNISFSSDGKFRENSFYLDESNVCKNENNNGTWENLGNSNYKTNQTTEAVKIAFSNSNNNFSITSTETFNGQTDTYVTVYKRN